MSEERKTLAEKREEIRERFYDNLLVDSWLKFRYNYKKNRRSAGIQILATFLVAIYLGGYFGEMFLKGQGSIRRVYFDPVSIIIGCFTTIPGIFLLLILFIGINVLMVQLGLLLTKDANYDAEHNYYKSKKGTFGSGHFMTEAEEESAFNRSKDIMEFKEPVLGLDDAGYMCARKEKEATNGNLAIIGSSGSQKSTALMSLHIWQAIRRGESIITTDTKGEMHMLSAAIARLAGYTIKRIILLPGFLSHSDAFNVMSVIGDDEGSEEICDDIVEAIMKNTNDGMKTDYFYKAEQNLLSAVVRLVAFSKNILEKDKNLAYVYDIIGNNDVDGIIAIFKSIKPGHPAYQPYKSWLNAKNSREDSLGGLGIRLTKLSSKTVKGLVGHNEVDFTLPGREKCIYYVVLSDKSKTYKFLSSLFITTMFNQLKSYADALPSQSLPVRVNFIIDEAKACGAIPDFGDHMSTIRSRNIIAEFATQDIGQLEDMYPGNEYLSVLNNCQMQMLLGTGDPKTAEHFSTLCDTETVVSESESYEDEKIKLIKLFNRTRKSRSESKKELMPVGEILHMSNDKLLLYIKGEPGVIKLNKMPYYKDFPGSNYNYFNDRPGHNCYYNGYPLMPYIKKENILEHVPEWREEYLQEMEMQKRIENAKSGAPIESRRKRA